jgi:hypothetical protein
LGTGRGSEGSGWIISGEGEGEGEEEASVAEVVAVAGVFGTGGEKKRKDNTPANAVRAIKTMATAPNRLFIFYLTTWTIKQGFMFMQT